MKHPDLTDAEFDLAAAWLRCNQGPDGEHEACEAVAAWIEHHVYERWLRRQARAAGVPVAPLRRKMAEAKAALEALK